MIYDIEKINFIRDELIKRGKTLAVAESVTSGHLQASFSAALEASRFFQGGLTAYNGGQKCRQLNIEPIHALANNCVSEVVTNGMAIHINHIFLSHYGIGITGYATKQPELNINELYAYYAISFEGKILVTKKITSSKEEGIDVQLDYTRQVITEFADLLRK